jgi:glycosyltransferase involved in cell wall biosynthesis
VKLGLICRMDCGGLAWQTLSLARMPPGANSATATGCAHYFGLIGSSDRAELYASFDVLILPRRYGGLCLPMSEALASGLPVIMSNTSPNDAILPADWLVPGAFNGGFTSRVAIQYFNVNIAVLAQKLDEWATMPDEMLDQHKARALELSRQWDPRVLRPQYEAVFTS